MVAVLVAVVVVVGSDGSLGVAVIVAAAVCMLCLARRRGPLSLTFAKR